MKKIGNTIKDMLCYNLLLKAISVLVAIVIWLLVINIDDPQVTTTIRNIPVRIVNEGAITDNDKVYDILSGDTVDIKVTGPRTLVDSLQKSDFTAEANFSDLSITNAVPIDVSINNGRYESKITISEKSENAMRLRVRELIEKEYELAVVQSGNPEQGFIMYKANPEEQTVLVKAPESVHATISKIAVIVNFNGDENENLKYTGAVVAYDNNNKIMDTKEEHITIDRVTMPVDVVLYYKQTLDIEYNVTDNFSENILMTGYEASIKHIDIVGQKDVLLDLDVINVPVDHVVFTDDKQEIIINLQNYLPDGVFIYNSNGLSTVKATVEEIITKSFTINSEDIGIRKIPTGYEASINEDTTLTVTLMGREEDLSELDIDKLAPYVDLSETIEGSNKLLVNLVVPDEITQVSQVYVEVTLTLKASGEPDSDADGQQSTTGGQQNNTDGQQSSTGGQQGGTDEQQSTTADASN